VAVNAPTTCTATVTDIGSARPGKPTGAVAFFTDASGSFSPAGCTLTGGSCTVTYTPTSVGAGTHDLTADYAGDRTHQPSHATATIAVAAPIAGAPLPGSATALACSPLSVAVNAPTTCTVTVTDTSPATPSTPTGVVTFSSDAGGSFSAAACTLEAGTCDVTYTPAAVGDSAVTARYAGDLTHRTSDATSTLAVTLRSTATSLGCEPATVVVGQPTWCTATVTDTAAGTSSTPTGTVTFSSDSPGSFNPTACTLSAVTNASASASCAVTYTPTSCPPGQPDITASYGCDAIHAGDALTQPQDTQTRGEREPPARRQITVHSVDRARSSPPRRVRSR
jgi:hypothetical protein